MKLPKDWKMDERWGALILLIGIVAAEFGFFVIARWYR